MWTSSVTLQKGDWFSASPTLLCRRLKCGTPISFDHWIVHSVICSFIHWIGHLLEQVTKKTFVWLLKSVSSPCFGTMSIRECYDIRGWKDELAKGTAGSSMAYFLWNQSQKAGATKVSIPRSPSQHVDLMLHWKLDSFPSVQPLSSLLCSNLWVSCLAVSPLLFLSLSHT